MPNALYYGDNLEILREHIADESVDLIYLDPPFNSQATYNVLFRAPTGEQSQAQIEAFEDTWHWNETAEQAFDEVMQSGNTDAAEMLRAMRSFLKENDVMAYLAMMAVRLLELQRVLNQPAGSIFIAIQPRVIILKSYWTRYFDLTIFGVRLSGREALAMEMYLVHSVDLTDTILYYTRTDHFVWNQQFTSFALEYIEEKFRGKDPDGRRWQSVTLRNPGIRPNLHYPYAASNGVTYLPHPNGWSCDPDRMKRYDRENRLHFPTKQGGQLRLKMYLDETPGVRLQNLWDDIPAVNSQAQERLGYPTQKPVALLERILATSSNPNEIVLDPFCGCGTAVHAAQKLGRRWIGIDITHLAISLIEKRLNDAFPGIVYEVHGTPKDLEGAHAASRGGQVPVPVVGGLAGQCRALRRQEARRRHRHRRAHLLQAGRQDDREGDRLGQGWRQRQCGHDLRTEPCDRPGESQGRRVHHARRTNQADADRGHQRRILRNRVR